MNLSETEALLALSLVSTLGPSRIKKLIGFFGSCAGAMEAPFDEVCQIVGFGSKFKEHWNYSKACQSSKKELDLCTQNNIEIIPYFSEKYPKHLLEIPDHPVILYQYGTLREEDTRSIAIVGTRNATTYGKECATYFAKDLSHLGFTIVSGLARGVDTYAHEGALHSGRTIAVIGSGLKNIYPKENHVLAEQIAKQGALLSEYPLLTPPDRQNFPRRNRIVSGMTLATLLIEAPLISGAMLTMENALDQKRLTLCIPGRIDNENFTGNHMLIKTGKAQLVENPQDVIQHIQKQYGLSVSPKETHLMSKDVKLEGEEGDLLQKMGKEEVSLDELVIKTGYTPQKLNVLLMSLVLKKVIKELPGKFYKVNR